jgi:hypothetical protein
MMCSRLVSTTRPIATIQSDRAGNEGKAQEPLPIGTGGHEKLLTQQKLRIQNSVAGIVPAFKMTFK